MSPRSKTAQVNLSKLFSTVTKTLKENQAALNAADDANHNHGDNMVQNFQAITKATREMKGCTPAEQLAHAGQVLAQQSQSGSADLYAQGLTRAAHQLRGSPSITQENALLLVQSLLGGGQGTTPGGAPAGGGIAGLLGSLLGGQGGQSAGSGDMIDQVLGTLMGGQQGASQQNQEAGGIDVNTLLVAGIAFFQARKKGAAPVDAIAQAVLAGSQMLNSTHHAQSGQLVAESLLNSLGTMLVK